MSDKIFPENEENVISDTEEPERQQPSLALDLGDDCVHNLETSRLAQASASAAAAPAETSGNTKRDDNPFSFKQFLRGNTTPSNNYQALGARPKVYNNRENRSNNRQVTPPPESPQRPSNRKINEISSALPDFVQDHLVIEQCFLGNHPPTISRSSSLEDPIPLDLPGLSFPAPAAEVGNSKSLPDFLTDGPVKTSDAATIEAPNCKNCIELTAEIINLRQRLNRAAEEADRNYRRAIATETKIAMQKQETQNLKAQLRQMQHPGGASIGGEDAQLQVQAHRLAQELRSAASTAEHSLRSLLTGVDNLRIMASNLDNMNNRKPSDKYFRYNDDNAGPNI